jgi:uncharacterized protein
VDDHFKSVVISADAKLEESIGHDNILDEDYIIVTAPGVKIEQARYEGMEGAFPGFDIANVKGLKRESVQVIFIPFYYRGNRGGRGHMRVGFKNESTIDLL